MYKLSCAVFQLSRSIGQIIASDKGVPLVNALVLDNLCETVLPMHTFEVFFAPLSKACSARATARSRLSINLFGIINLSDQYLQTTVRLLLIREDR